MTQPQQSTMSHPQILLFTPILNWVGPTCAQDFWEPGMNELSWSLAVTQTKTQPNTSKSELEKLRKEAIVLRELEIK